MTPETRDTIDALTELLIDMTRLERTLGKAILKADDDARTEIAFYVEDSINQHPRRPLGMSTSLERVEAYISYRAKIEGWRVKSDELDEEWERLQEEMVNLLDDVSDDLDDDDLDLNERF